MPAGQGHCSWSLRLEGSALPRGPDKSMHGLIQAISRRSGRESRPLRCHGMATCEHACMNATKRRPARCWLPHAPNGQHATLLPDEQPPGRAAAGGWLAAGSGCACGEQHAMTG